MSVIVLVSTFVCLTYGQLVMSPQEENGGPMAEYMNDMEELASLRAAGVSVDPEDISRQMFASELLPEPFALFPLIGKDVNSVDGIYQGDAGSVVWIEDDRFGVVPLCDQENITHVIQLESVPYYINGQMAVNFWFKSHNISGEHFQYMFSHSSKVFQDALLNLNQGVNAGWSPNQFNVFIPEYDHFSHGVLRVLMKDANDVYLGRRSQTWVDSDTQVGINTGARMDTIDPADGRWHMATVTTRDDGLRGYQLYLDGELAGEMEEGNQYLGPGNDILDINGGDPILLDGNITICGRSDRHPERDFEGSIVYLSLFDTFLTAEQIAYMYDLAGGIDVTAVADLPVTRPNRESAAFASPAQTTVVFGPKTLSGEECQFPYTYEGQVYNECILVDDLQKCKTASNEMEQCIANVGMPTSTPLADDDPRRHNGRVTITGEACQFPFMNDRVMVFDCVERNGVDTCQTESGLWQQCAPRDSAITPSLSGPSSQLPQVGPTTSQDAVVSLSSPTTGPTVLTPTQGFSYLPIDQDMSPSPAFPVFTMPSSQPPTVQAAYGQSVYPAQGVGMGMGPAPVVGGTTNTFGNNPTSTYTPSLPPTTATQQQQQLGTTGTPQQMTGTTGTPQQTTTTLADVYGANTQGTNLGGNP
eukprot:TRINITY_DN4161_c1_g2_i1.p1 TRINITY_DN4161_c1_g2~~TRINITY_DN4161_c1_g2_i1.p1  ORF type:complete len:685 (+),score=111.18 TRINITY_DN4161_c1_g2_i1:127-2055(+)